MDFVQYKIDELRRLEPRPKFFDEMWDDIYSIEDEEIRILPMKASEARKISEDTTSKAVQNLRFLVDSKVHDAAKKHNFSVDVYVGEFNNNVLNLVKKSLEDDGFTVSYKRSYDMRDGNYSTMTVKW